jgi:tripartite-type tricarboxylate transporter receptor subunit TctC
MMAMQRVVVACGFLSVAVLLDAAAADSVTDFYKGRTLTIVVGNEVGTGFDIYARTLARHLGRHIPGQPNVVVQNMVGASGIVAANWLYAVAAKDGSVIATFVHTVPFEPLMGNGAARYDSAKFTWIGNMESIVGICGVSRASGIGKFSDLLETETVFGATGATGAVAKHALALKHLFGAKVKLVTGYQGTGSIKLAMQRGEVAGICSLGMSTVAASWKEEFESGAFRPIIQLSGGVHPDLKGVPHVNDFAKSSDDGLVIDLIYGTQTAGRPYAAPPGVPPERKNALRAAFKATMADPQFLADAARTQIDITPTPGDEVEAFMGRMMSASPQVVERAKQAFRND